MDSELYARLERLSGTSPIVHQCLQMHRWGEPMEEVLVRCIEELDKSRCLAVEDAVKYAMMVSPPPIPVGDVK